MTCEPPVGSRTGVCSWAGRTAVAVNDGGTLGGTGTIASNGIQRRCGPHQGRIVQHVHGQQPPQGPNSHRVYQKQRLIEIRAAVIMRTRLKPGNQVLLKDGWSYAGSRGPLVIQCRPPRKRHFVCKMFASRARRWAGSTST